MTIRALKDALAALPDTGTDGQEFTVWMQTVGLGGSYKQVESVGLLSDIFPIGDVGDIVLGGKKHVGAT